MSEDFMERATEIVDIIRSQNWKNGGAHKIDHSEAVDLIAQALRAAHAEGCAEGAKTTGESMMRVLDVEISALR